MNAARDRDPVPVSDLTHSDAPGEQVVPIEPEPSLADLSPEANGRIVRYIVTKTLETFHGRLVDRLPELFDLEADAQQRIRRFAIEERLERGLPPVELLDLYRGFEIAGDERAQQYLDRVYVEREPPGDWLDLQSEAGRLVDLAEARGRDAGRLFADLLRTSPAIEPMTAVRLLMERLIRQA